jgi:hypothetical protein
MEDKRRRVTTAMLGLGLSVAVAAGVSACGSSTTKTTPGNPAPANTTPASTTPPSGGGVSY